MERLRRAIGAACVLHFDPRTWEARPDLIPPCAEEIAAEYARLSVNEGGVAPVEPQEPR